MIGGTKTPVARGSAGSYGKLPRGRRKADGLSSEQVAAHQRLRLFEAMTQLAGTRGYAAATTDELSRIAEMSKQDMYKRFPSKEEYFLATYDFIVHRTVKRIGAAYSREGQWRERLRRAFAEFAALVVEKPCAAKLVLVEVLGDGAGVLGDAPAVVGRMERTRGIFERILSESLNEAPDGVRLPPLVTKGIVCGVERITRQRLVAGGIEELPELVDELLEWALSYRSAAVTALPDHRPAGAPLSFRARDSNEHARILNAAASLAANNGYSGLTPGRIIERADVSLETFNALYPDVEECFLAALERLGIEALVCVASAGQDAEGRLASVHRGIAALMEHVAGDPVLRRVAFVEVFAVGKTGVDRREALLYKFNARLAGTLPPGVRATDLAVEGVVGAIWGLVHHHVVHGTAQQLPTLTNQASYLALAPFVGGDEAVRLITTTDPRPT